MEKIEIKNLVYQEFLGIKLKEFKSYGSYLVAQQKEDLFVSQLTDQQKQEFENVMDAQACYNYERETELIDYVFNFLKSFFK